MQKAEFYPVKDALESSRSNSTVSERDLDETAEDPRNSIENKKEISDSGDDSESLDTSFEIDEAVEDAQKQLAEKNQTFFVPTNIDFEKKTKQELQINDAPDRSTIEMEQDFDDIDDQV